MDRADHVERLDIVVKGRHTEVTERFREHVKEKLVRLERLDSKAFRIDVEICHEVNPRLAGQCDRVELTLRSRGPVVRAEAAAQDPYAALDLAVAKLEERLRRAADRRRTRHQQHHGHASQVRGAAETVVEDVDTGGALGSFATDAQGAGGRTQPSANGNGSELDLDAVDDEVVLTAGPLVVREKAHDATPMQLDEALHRMELVGHDFYLYCDADSGLPSVVYRRRGYTYGVLRLRLDSVADSAG